MNTAAKKASKGQNKIGQIVDDIKEVVKSNKDEFKEKVLDKKDNKLSSGAKFVQQKIVNAADAAQQKWDEIYLNSSQNSKNQGESTIEKAKQYAQDMKEAA